MKRSYPKARVALPPTERALRIDSPLDALIADGLASYRCWPVLYYPFLALSESRPVDLAPPQYLRDIVAYLRREEPKLWARFASQGFEDERAATVRLDLLKATVRLDRATHGALYT